MKPRYTSKQDIYYSTGTDSLQKTTGNVVLREESQEKMRVSERRYRHFFETGKDGVLILDAASRKIIEANPLMTELLGYAHEEFIGKELWEFGFLQDEAASKNAFRELQKRKFIRYEDLPLRTKDGRTIQVEFVSNLYCEGCQAIVQCNVRDVTERKHVAQKLAEKARLLDLSNDAIIVRDLHDNITLWNKGAEKLFGWTAGKVMGKHLHTLLQTEFPRPIEEIVAQLHLDGEFCGEVLQIARDGRRIPLICRWVWDRDTGSILTSCTDITDRKRAEETLERIAKERTESVKSLETLSYTIAHDLRAPIRAMKGFLEALVEEVPLAETGKEYVQRIQQAAERMGRLVEDLLQYSRLAHQELPISPVDLKTEVEKIAAEMAKEIQATNATFEVREPLPAVSGNTTLIDQILCNLLGNALKFVAPGVTPRILLRTETRGSTVRLWVEDNGIGIAPEYQAQIFGVFQRLHSNEEFPGTGLGLAIIKRAAEYMGGAVGVESEPGKGSRFWVDFRKA